MNAKILFSLIILFAPSFAFAHPGHQPPVMPKEFETLKKLIGTWEGTTTMNGKEENMKVTYALTSGGTAIEEREFAGTPNEMVSIYHKEGKSLAMTHFCALGNQPHMAMKKATADSLAFEMTKSMGLVSPKEEHMHAVTLTFTGPDTLKQEWTHYADGKATGTVAFNFKRSK